MIAELSSIFSWGSPVGIGIFFIGLGIFMGLFFWGIKQVSEAKK